MLGTLGATVSTVNVRVGPSVMPLALLARAYSVRLPCPSAPLVQLNVPLLHVVLHRVLLPSRTAMLLPLSHVPLTTGVVVATYAPLLGLVMLAAAGGGRLTVNVRVALYPVFPAASVSSSVSALLPAGSGLATQL